MKTKSILLGMALAIMPAFSMADNNVKMVVGTYTDAGSEGLYSFDFDQVTGTATELSSLKIDDPSYLLSAKTDVISTLLVRRIIL